MNLGERISPFCISNIRSMPFNVEPLSDARTPLAVFFSILLKMEKLFAGPRHSRDGGTRVA
jgi:hypothetical protein